MSVVLSKMANIIDCFRGMQAKTKALLQDSPHYFVITVHQFFFVFGVSGKEIDLEQKYMAETYSKMILA